MTSNAPLTSDISQHDFNINGMVSYDTNLVASYMSQSNNIGLSDPSLIGLQITMANNIDNVPAQLVTSLETQHPPLSLHDNGSKSNYIPLYCGQCI